MLCSVALSPAFYNSFEGPLMGVVCMLQTASIMKGTKVLTLSAHNLEKMMTTPYHQHSYLSSSVPVFQLMHSHAMHTIPNEL